MKMGRWVVGGWIAFALIVVGAVVGFMLYTRVVVGVTLKEQAALLMLPPELTVHTRATEKAAITLQGEVGVDVPFQHDALPLPIRGSYRTNIAMDTTVPLRMMIEYNDVIPVDTSVKVDGDTGVVFKWLPHFPLKGEVPLRLDVPVSLKVPVDTRIRFVYDGPAEIQIDQILRPAVDTTLHTRIALDKEVDAPVTNTFMALVRAKELALPVMLTDTELTLPLRNLNLTTRSIGNRGREAAR